MRSPRISKRGSAITVVLAILTILGGVGAVLLSVAMARMSAITSLEARLEAERIARGLEGALKSQAYEIARSDAMVAGTVSFTPPTVQWEAATVSAASSFPVNLLREPRDTQADARDLGAPGALPWLATHSEAVQLTGKTTLTRPSQLGGTDLTLAIDSSATVWRVPAAAVRLLVSRQALTVSGFTVEAEGPAVYAFGAAPAAIVASSTFLSSSAAPVTAGGDPTMRVDEIYRNPSWGGVYETTVADTSSPPAAIEAGEIGGARFAVINLATYTGPRVISVRTSGGDAQGLVLIGSVSGGSPLSISSDSPIYFAGSNRRYVLAATKSAEVGFLSTAAFDGAAGLWRFPLAGADASDQAWDGHVFIGAVDPRFRLTEQWASARLILHGSLHVLGGRLTQVGPGAGSLVKLSISEPDWAAVGNPFTPELRHESFLTLTR